MESNIEIKSLVDLGSIQSSSVESSSSIIVSKASIMTYFPNSLLSTTLELDPTAEVIDIPNSSVDSDILLILKYITVTGHLPSRIPYLPNLITASNYLGIDILTALGDPTYPLFIETFPDTNLLDPVSIQESYSSILNFIVSNNSKYILSYIIRIMPHNMEQFGFTYRQAVWNGKLDIVDLLIRNGYRSIDWNKDIQTAIVRHHSNLLYYFIQSPIVNPHINYNDALISAIDANDVTLIDYLLINSPIDPSKIKIGLYILPNTSIQVINRLLEDPRINLSDVEIDTLRSMTNEGNISSLIRLLEIVPFRVLNHVYDLYQFGSRIHEMIRNNPILSKRLAEKI